MPHILYATDGLLKRALRDSVGSHISLWRVSLTLDLRVTGDQEFSHAPRELSSATTSKGYLTAGLSVSAKVP